MSRVRRDWSLADHVELHALMRRELLSPVEWLTLERLSGRFRRYLRDKMRPPRLRRCSLRAEAGRRVRGREI
jgi:hypothetical protein